MKTKNKGCVYFFKHKNLSPIKIGYSSKNNPNERFDQFKTYAPFGGEIVGFIEIEFPLYYEQLIHSKFKSKRLNGEWFDITIAEVKDVISIYSTGIYFFTKDKPYNKKNYLLEIKDKFKFLTDFLDINIQTGLVMTSNKLWKEYIKDLKDASNFLFEKEFNKRLDLYCLSNDFKLVRSTNKKRLEFIKIKK